MGVKKLIGRFMLCSSGKDFLGTKEQGQNHSKDIRNRIEVN